MIVNLNVKELLNYTKVNVLILNLKDVSIVQDSLMLFAVLMELLMTICATWSVLK